MHFECKNQNYPRKGQKCPGFGVWVQKRTVTKREHALCLECHVEMKAISPPGKRGSPKAELHVSSTSSSRRKFSFTKKNGIKKAFRKRVSLKK